VRAKTKEEAERVGKSMIRPLLSLERLSFEEKEGKVSYRYGKEAEEVERMDYLEFIARVTSHIPDKGRVMVRYFGLYGNAHRSKVHKSEEAAGKLVIIEEESPRIPRRGWAEMIRKVYEVERSRKGNYYPFGNPTPAFKPDAGIAEMVRQATIPAGCTPVPGKGNSVFATPMLDPTACFGIPAGREIRRRPFRVFDYCEMMPL